MGERARKTLNRRQQEVRKALVRGRGMVNNAELAEELGVSRQQIWRDRRVISQLRPVLDEAWDEPAEVEKILADYENQIAQTSDELERLEREASQRAGSQSVTGLFTVRLGLLRELRQVLESRQAFLVTIGYIKAAPTKFEHDVNGLGNLNGEALDHEIGRLEGIVNGTATAAGKAAGR